MLSVTLEHKISIVVTLEIANERAGVCINIAEEDCRNAALIAGMLESFREAVKIMEGDNLGLSQIPAIMVILNSHIKSQTAAFEGAFAEAREAILIDHADRWDEVPDVIRMAAALNSRTKDLGWMSTQEKKEWRDLLLDELKILFQDIRSEQAAMDLGGVGGCIDEGADWRGGSDAVRRPKTKKRDFLSRAVETTRILGAGDGPDGDEEQPEQFPQRTRRPASGLSLSQRIEHAQTEIQRFVLQEGLRDDDDDDDYDEHVVKRSQNEEKQRSTCRDEELSWWCRHQFSFPSLTRLASSTWPFLRYRLRLSAFSLWPETSSLRSAAVSVMMRSMLLSS